MTTKASSRRSKVVTRANRCVSAPSGRQLLIGARFGIAAVMLLAAFVLPLYGLWASWPSITAMLHGSWSPEMMVTIIRNGEFLFGGMIAMMVSLRALGVIDDQSYTMFLVGVAGVVACIWVPSFL